MRIGILGGTFNPIHNGHIRLAKEVKRRLKLDKVIFVPAYIPPHKLSQDMLNARQRYQMVKFALGDTPGMEVSDYEIRAKGRSYSVRTLKAFRHRFGKKARLYFICGADSLKELKHWRGFPQIFKLANFVAAWRPGHKLTPYPGVVVLKIRALNISSTQIRQAIREGKSRSQFLPARVSRYILEKGLYR